MTDPTSRALKLLSLLGHRSVWSGAELAAELGVTPRTLRRDVDRLRHLGYTVDAAPGLGGGYALRRGGVLPALTLDEDEALAVTIALTAASGYLIEADAGRRALAKIDAVLPPPVRTRMRGTREATDLSAAGTAVDSAVLGACADGTRRRRRMRFHYVDRRGRCSERWVEPHQVSCRGQVWYVTAYDVARADWRSFRLDRMADVRVGDWVFHRRPDAADALQQALEPVPPSVYEHRVVLRVHCGIEHAPEFMTWEGALLRELEPGLCEYVTGVDDPEQAAVWLAGIGHEFTVVEDADVREAMTDLGERLLRAVGDTPLGEDGSRSTS